MLASGFVMFIVMVVLYINVYSFLQFYIQVILYSHHYTYIYIVSIFIQISINRRWNRPCLFEVTTEDKGDN